MRDLAELAIELDQATRQVVEAAMRLLSIVLEDERVHLLLKELDVCGQREHVLDRPVVEIEAEPHQPTLGRRDQRALTARRVLEQALTLDDRAQRRRRLAEVRVGHALLHRSDASHDGRERLAEAEHGRGAQLRAAEEREARAAAKGRLRLGANASARPHVGAQRDDALEP